MTWTINVTTDIGANYPRLGRDEEPLPPSTGGPSLCLPVLPAEVTGRVRQRLAGECVEVGRLALPAVACARARAQE